MEKSTDNIQDVRSSKVEKPVAPSEKLGRSFAKALSWRVVGTLDTFFLSFVIIKFLGPLFGMQSDTSSLHIMQAAGLIAITEVLTKIVIFLVHERAWNRIHWGVGKRDGRRHESRRRSLIKMSTWRVLASLDTMVLAWIFTGNIRTAISIGGFEIITKLVLYYFHERAWLLVRRGVG